MEVSLITYLIAAGVGVVLELAFRPIGAADDYIRRWLRNRRESPAPTHLAPAEQITIFDETGAVVKTFDGSSPEPYTVPKNGYVAIYSGSGGGSKYCHR